jgi:hypothetical protein
MTKNKTLSNLSIAAIALLAAAVPCVAQSQSNHTDSRTLSAVEARGTGLSLAFNKNPFAGGAAGLEASAVESKTTVKVASAKSSPRLTVATFNSASQFTTESKRFFSAPLTAYEPVTFDSKPQFRVDDYTPSKPSRVSFVPSRGPWMPN